MPWVSAMHLTRSEEDHTKYTYGVEFSKSIVEETLSISKPLDITFLQHLTMSSVVIKLLNSKLTVFNIYRNHYLPNTSKKSNTSSKSSHDPVPFSDFLADLHILIATAATTPHDFIITGDFNLHIDNISDPRTQQFMSLLENSNLTQHVSFPTHQHGHILDLVITNQRFNTTAINHTLTHFTLWSFSYIHISFHLASYQGC